MNLEERVAKLERESRRLRRAGILAAAGLLALLAAGAAGPPDGTLSAREFRVQDNEGRLRARLGMRGGSVGLTLFAHDGSVVGLWAGLEGGRLFLRDARRRDRAVVSMERGRPAIALLGADGRPRWRAPAR